MYMPFKISDGLSCVLHQEEGWHTLIGARLLKSQHEHSQELVSATAYFGVSQLTQRSVIFHEARCVMGDQQCEDEGGG
jgi:hypothetical protein